MHPPAGRSSDDTDAAMLAATALGLSIVPRDGAVQVLWQLADSRAAALEQARTRLGELHDIDEATVERARLLLTAAADEAQLAG